MALRVVGFTYRLLPERVEFGYPDPEILENRFIVDPDLLWVRPGYYRKLEMGHRSKPSMVLMGCSCTELGRYDEALAELLASSSAVEGFSYLNLGVSGWSSYQGLAQLRRDVIPLRPRVVSFYFGWNDHWVGLGIRDRDAARVHQAPTFGVGDIRTYQLVAKAWSGLRQREAFPLRVPPAEFRSNLTAMVRESRRHGMAPLLLTAPTDIRQGQEPKPLEGQFVRDLSTLVPTHQEYVRTVREVAHEEKAALCDLEAFFSGLEPDQRAPLFMDDGIHLTVDGNRQIAIVLYRCLAENQLLTVLDD